MLWTHVWFLTLSLKPHAVVFHVWLQANVCSLFLLCFQWDVVLHLLWLQRCFMALSLLSVVRLSSWNMAGNIEIFFSISQNFFHSPCSGDFLNAFCFLRMFWYQNPELPLCCQLLLSIVAALVAGSCSNEWFSLPIRLGGCQRYLWSARGTCVIAKRNSRSCWESSSITAHLGSLLASLAGMICPKSPMEDIYNDSSSPTA